ncbi:MAG TPA: NAD(P)/FAD-dependent oxidoreductase [Anaerolineales bacterium]
MKTTTDPTNWKGAGYKKIHQEQAEVRMDYEVIIAGGSFAGLAVAAQLRDRRVLLVEPHAIGALQTSACGTLLAVLEATGTMDSLLQIHDYFALHLRDRTVEYALPYSFCTFDYHTFCYRLLAQGNAELLQASVLSHRGHLVYTTKGVFSTEILVDATGWRAALATNSGRQAEQHRGKSFGLETVIPIAEEGLHFYYDSPRLGPHNVGWLFPTGALSRAGFASYQGHTQLNQALRNFVQDQFGRSPDGQHGGYFPYRSQPATSGQVFRVGDAAGQCLPFSGEGIRPALYFGAAAGRLARRVLDGELRAADALHSYRQFVEQHRPAYRVLLAAQKILPGLPMAWIEALAGLAQPDPLIGAILRLYWETIDPHAFGWPAEKAGVSTVSPLRSAQSIPARIEAN